MKICESKPVISLIYCFKRNLQCVCSCIYHIISYHINTYRQTIKIKGEVQRQYN